MRNDADSVGTRALGGESTEVDVEGLAERMADRLNDADHLRGVGYYSPTDSGPVYLRDDVQREYIDDETLEDAVMESIAAQNVEKYYDDEMVETIRVFEEKVVVYCCAARLQGVLVSFDRDESFNYQRLLTVFEEERPD